MFPRRYCREELGVCPRARHVTDIQIRRNDDAGKQSLGAGYAIAYRDDRR